MSYYSLFSDYQIYSYYAMLLLQKSIVRPFNKVRGINYNRWLSASVLKYLAVLYHQPDRILL